MRSRSAWASVPPPRQRDDHQGAAGDPGGVGAARRGIVALRAARVLPTPAPRPQRRHRRRFDRVVHHEGRRDGQRDRDRDRQGRAESRLLQRHDHPPAERLVHQVQRIGHPPQRDQRTAGEQRQAPARGTVHQQAGADRDHRIAERPAHGDGEDRERDEPEREAPGHPASVMRVQDHAEREPRPPLGHHQRLERRGPAQPGQRRQAGREADRTGRHDRDRRAAQRAGTPEQQHPRVEQQLDPERPVRAVDRGDAEVFLDHRQVDGDVGQRALVARHLHDAQRERGQQDCDPVGREQPRGAREDEVRRRSGAIDRHQDHEAADDEEQLDAEVAEGEPERQRLHVHQGRVVTGGEVEADDRQRRQRAQAVELREAPGFGHGVEMRGPRRAGGSADAGGARSAPVARRSRSAARVLRRPNRSARRGSRGRDALRASSR